MSYIMERPEGSPNTLVTQQEKPGSRYGLYQGDIKSEAYAQPNHMEKLPESLRIKSGHGGSHTFITHEFISAIVEDRASQGQHLGSRCLHAARHHRPQVRLARRRALEDQRLRKGAGSVNVTKRAQR